MNEEEYRLTESILKVLLFNCLYNDSKRFLAGLRRPHRVTRDVMKDLVELYENNSLGG